MRVLHVVDSGGFYGAEAMLLHLARAQRRLGIDAEICSIGEPRIKQKELEASAERAEIPVYRVRMRRGMNVTGAWGILKYAKRGQFDVLHSHGYKGNILLGFIPTGVRDIPLVSTLHGWTATKGMSALHVYEWLDRISLRYHDAVVAVSDAMPGDVRISRLVRNRMTVIPNGIPIDADDNALQQGEARELAEFCAGGFVIGAIGRLSREKAHEYLLEAIALLRSKGRNVRLVIIGEGPERQRLEEYINRLGLRGQVRLTGHRDRAERYLGLFDVFVICSVTEGLPISLLEAARAKVPIVATRVGGIPGVFRKGLGASLVRPGDVGTLANAISELMEHPDRAQEMAEFSYRLFAESYTSDRMAERYLAVYRDVAAHATRLRSTLEPRDPARGQ